MKFTNQLQIKIVGSAGRMCSNIIEVDDFLKSQKHYTMNDLEYHLLDNFLQSVLPEREFKPEEKKRFSIFLLPNNRLKRFYSDRDFPSDGKRVLEVLHGAYTSYCNPIATFWFGDKNNEVVLRISRKRETDSHPLSFIEDCWIQQAASFLDKKVPKVFADLSPLKVSEYTLPKGPEYTLKSGQLEYLVSNPADMLFALKSILLRHVSKELKNIIYDLFNHLDHFERNVAFSMPVPLYSDDRRVLYAGGDGTNNFRKLLYIGQLYTQYFSGLPGNVFKLNLRVLEDEDLNILLIRNGIRK